MQDQNSDTEVIMCKGLNNVMANTSVQYALLVVLALSIFHTNGLDQLESIFEDFPMASGRLQGQRYVYIGDSVRLNCSLESTDTYTSSDIKFGFAQPMPNGKNHSYLASDLVKVVNESTAELTVPIHGLSEQGQYNCYVGTRFCHMDKQCKLVDSADIAVEYPPQNVTGLKCMVVNYNEGMVCTWQHAVPYIHPHHISVKCDYTTLGSTRQGPCPNMSGNPIEMDSNGTQIYSMRWGQKDDFAFAPMYFIQMAVTNSVTQDRTSSVFRVRAFDSVKPATVGDLDAEEISVGCVSLTWADNNPRFNKTYRVRRMRIDPSHQQPLSLLATDLSESSFQQCGYGPYETYQFVVDAQPANPYNGFWSDPASVTLRTREIAPDEGPEMTNGSYRDRDCYNGVRNVTLFWKEVPEESRNGKIIQYVVRVGQSENISSTVPHDQFSTTVQLPCEETFVHVFAENSAGDSVQPSSLLIPSTKTDIPAEVHESFIIEITEKPGKPSILRAVWKNKTETEKEKEITSSLRERLTYTVFWCSGVRSRELCQGPISWLIVPDGHDYADISPLNEDPTHFLFGISVLDSKTGFASQISWATCLVNNRKGTVPPPANVEARSEILGFSVTWQHIVCSYDQNVKVDKYIVKYQKAGQFSKDGRPY